MCVFVAVDCSCLGRVQSFISQLLYVTVGEAEQPLSTLPAGVGCPANWKVIYGDVATLTKLSSSFAALVCLKCMNSLNVYAVACAMLHMYICVVNSDVKNNEMQKSIDNSLATILTLFMDTYKPYFC